MKKLLAFLLFPSLALAQTQITGSAVQIGGANTTAGVSSAQGTDPIQVNGDSDNPHTGDLTVSCPTCGMASFRQALSAPPPDGQHVTLVAQHCGTGDGNMPAGCGVTGMGMGLDRQNAFSYGNTASVYDYVLPSSINPANVTAVYVYVVNYVTPLMVYGTTVSWTGGGETLPNGYTNITTDGFTPDKLASLSINASGVTSAPAYAVYASTVTYVLVYYTGDPIADNATNVLWPLQYDPTGNNLFFTSNFDYAQDFGLVNAYQAIVPLLQNPTAALSPKVGDQVVLFVANSNTITNPTLAIPNSASTTPRPIINQDGTALSVGALQVHVPALLIFDGASWRLQGQGSGGGSTAFSGITNGTNTTAAMHVGSGASLDATGTGTVNANQVNGGTIPSSKAFVGTNGSKQIVDASTTYGTNSTKGLLQCDGTTLTCSGGVATAVGGGGGSGVPLVVTTSGTLATCNIQYVVNSGSATTQTLSTTAGCSYAITNKGAGTVTIDPNGLTQDGTFAPTLQTGDSSYYSTDGTAYYGNGLTTFGSGLSVSRSAAGKAVTATGGGGGSLGPNSWVFAAGVNGGTCDDSTDDTTAFNALLSTAYTADGGTISVQGTCLISGGITIPNSGASSHPSQPTFRITGVGGSANGSWNAPPATAGTLDLRNNASTGKILTIGEGKLEIDHLTLKDGGSDCAAFIYTTNTTLAIHDNQFSGTAAGTSACNDAVILGGTTTSFGTNSTTDAFQGYGTYIEHNFFDKIQRGAYFRVFAQGVTFKNNTFSASCGSSANGAVEIGTGTGTSDGNVFSGNLFEMTNYKYGYVIDASFNQIQGDTFWDKASTTTFVFHFIGGSNNTARVSTDSSFPASILTDSNQPNGSNSVMDQNWQTTLGLAASNTQLCNASGSGTAQTCTTGLLFTPANTTRILFNTATPNSSTGFTLNVNGSGAKSVKVPSPTGWTATLSAGQIPAGETPMFTDGTFWYAGPTGVTTLLDGNSVTVPIWGGTGGGSANAQTFTLSPTVPFLSPGIHVRWSPAAANTGATTLTVNGLTAKSVTKCGTTALTAGDLAIGAIADATYDGTEFQLNNPQGTACAGSAPGVTSIDSQTGAFTFGGSGVSHTGTSYTFTGGSGGGTLPFSIVQSTAFSTSGTSSSFTVTYPSTLAASGNTAFIMFSTAADSGTNITCPSGWTSDIDQSQASFSHVLVCHKASDGTSSVTLTSGIATGFAGYFYELSGSRTFDASSATGVTNQNFIRFPSITPTGSAMVFAVAGTRPNAATYYSLLDASGSPLWKDLYIASNNSTASPVFIASVYGGTAPASTAIQPPVSSFINMPLFSGVGIAYATFSVK